MLQESAGKKLEFNLIVKNSLDEFTILHEVKFEWISKPCADKGPPTLSLPLSGVDDASIPMIDFIDDPPLVSGAVITPTW